MAPNFVGEVLPGERLLDFNRLPQRQLGYVRITQRCRTYVDGGGSVPGVGRVGFLLRSAAGLTAGKCWGRAP